MDSRLFIAPEIAHLVEIYGLPGPRRKFYDDFHCQIRAKSSFWVYEDESPRSRDLGKVAPTPPPERLRLLQQSQLPVVDDGEQEDAVDTEFADLSPGHSMEDAVVESDLSSGGLDVEEPAPLTPPDTETNDGAEMKQSETVEDGTMWIPHMVASLVPGQTPVCTWNVSPFLKVFGIGSVEIVEFREWLQRTAPSLRRGDVPQVLGQAERRLV
ncbi:hypothetical protein C8R42DRAFT_688573 [Lentinula raphanica]|nr:hypothetical protein C8R42DRAFT_688573 [Lentinula raphanica]